MSQTKIRVDKYYDRGEHDPLKSQVTYGDPPFKKPSEPPKPILKPLHSRLEYTFLRGIKAIITHEVINLLINKPNIYYEESDMTSR